MRIDRNFTKKKQYRNVIATQGSYIHPEIYPPLRGGGECRNPSEANGYRNEKPKLLRMPGRRESGEQPDPTFGELPPVQFGGLLQIRKNQAWSAAVPLSHVRTPIQPGQLKKQGQGKAGLPGVRSKDARL
jgi:hypothetical protein